MQAQTKDEKALATITDFLAGGKKRKVYFSRRFYNGTKHLRITSKTAASALRMHKGKLQIWEGKTSGGWCDVVGHYKITGDVA